MKGRRVDATVFIRGGTWNRLRMRAEKLKNASTNCTMNPNSPKKAQMWWHVVPPAMFGC